MRDGYPGLTADPMLATIFSQVRENVDRFRLLLDRVSFPVHARRHRFQRLDPGGDQTTSLDTASSGPRAPRSYQVGHVVYSDYDAAGRRRQYMYLPTFRDLGDPVFLSAHCFSYRGTTALPGGGRARAVRIDFHPAASISTPDVEGSIFSMSGV